MRKKIRKKLAPRAWVVAVDMGYGHQRPAYCLRHLAPDGEVIAANSYPGIPDADRKIWKASRRFYEFISRLTHVPVVGRLVFSWYDWLQAIPPFYPRRDLSAATVQLRQIYRLIRRRQWGKHLINRLAKDPQPLITTFFVVAFMAEEFNYPGEIYCIATDTDVSRAWAPLRPQASRIQYLAPNYRVVERLKEYGVAAERIHLTGFPLPKENLGGAKLETVRRDLVHRLVNLDPRSVYRQQYQALITNYLKIRRLPARSDHPLTVTFSVGGAGAQRELGATILRSLCRPIHDGRVRLILVAGVHNSVSTYFRLAARRCGLGDEIGRGVEIIHASTKAAYFDHFHRALRTTDVLWTKPSELSFYTALGLPIVVAPPIGSQEVFNRKWLRTMGVAANQYPPQFTAEWLFDWVDSGWLAEAAMQGFIEAPKFGTYNIEQVISRKSTQARRVSMVLQY